MNLGGPEPARLWAAGVQREVAGARRQLLAEVAARVPARGEDCPLVAIDGVDGVDGVDGAGKSVFSDELADVLVGAGRTVLRASVDDFHHPRAVRHRGGPGSPVGFWLDSYDQDSLERDLLAPLRRGGFRSCRTAVHELATDRTLDRPLLEVPPGTVLVLDGLFLHRDELAGRWDLSVFLQVPFAVSVPRMATRDGTHPDPAHPSLNRYVGGQQLSFAACRPWARADVVIDNRDVNAPRIAPGSGRRRT
ncbi:uridine kinase [Modestobacter sp. DSM 44400]|uniref:hypothetical protein n=1 Tax=Modestobacter sp. DSM 44400 TaxID=1550230 RepID=UPI000895B673|nr:hypothetical protein [Modestobacter sp. DSM 44400]SDY07371.1 uridine kinase [Modestobacter sp. DSM 44400]